MVDIGSCHNSAREKAYWSLSPVTDKGWGLSRCTHQTAYRYNLSRLWINNSDR